VVDKPFLTEKVVPVELVPPPVKLTITLPVGRPHLKLISTSVAERLPSYTPPGRPKSAGDIILNSASEQSVEIKTSILLESTTTYVWGPLALDAAKEKVRGIERIMVRLITKAKPCIFLKKVKFSINDSFPI